MSDSEEDDAHFCLRCKGTFIGLDQYIEHRKVKCKREDSQPLTSLDLHFGKRSTEVEPLGSGKSGVSSGGEGSNRTSWALESLQNSSPSVKDARLDDVLEMNRKDEILDPFLPSHDNDSCLNAVDFFSILELQSSKNPTFQELSSSPRTQGGVLTRSKASAALQAKKSKEYYTPKPNVQEYDSDYQQSEHSQYVVGKDVIIADNYDYRKETSCVSKERKLSEVDSPKSKSRDEDRILDDDGKSCQFLFQEVHNEVTITAEEKSQEESDSFGDESDDEEEEDDEYLEYEPPRVSTGGKWKPEGHEWMSQPYWNAAPPANFTGGKWKPSPPSTATATSVSVPSTSSSQQEEAAQDDQSSDASKARIPPPGHTRGKWLPTLDSAERRFWCGPCNRRLSSLVLYEKHCRSDLHRRRTRQESLLEEDLSMDHPRPQGRRVVKKTRTLLDSDPELTGRPKRKRTAQGSSGSTSLTRARGGALQCLLCRCQVWPHLIGKHMVSHFHSRRARGAPDLARRLALDHMGSIVLQAPFQCALCRFYCNTTQAFLWHWRSDRHALRDSQVEGRYCCPICRVEVSSSPEMYQHLRSSRHRDSIAIINGSVPIVIQKKRILQCDVCGKQFSFNLELRQHGRSAGHPQTSGSASDRYQEREACTLCPFVAFTKLSLQRHLTIAHKDAEGRYFCSVCDSNFETACEAKSHRSTTGHKDAVLAKQGDKELAKVCSHCYGIFSGVTDLKKHLREEHPEMAYRCIKCGSRFTLKQELARHARVGCEGFAPSATSAPPSDEQESPQIPAFQCPKCNFSSDSEAELLFHLALHSDPVYDGDTPRYQCPSCPRVFLKSSLRKHLHSHTGERPYSCLVCGAGFARKDVLENHVVSVHSLKRSGDSWQPLPERSKGHGCQECGATFYDKSTLSQHRQIHRGKAFKCQEEGCVYSGRSRGDLQLHMRSHGEERPFQCNDCDFRTKTKAQLVRHGRTHLDTKSHRCPHCQFSCNSSTHLNRHLRLHTGAKPFHCPHCDFSCNLLENLRKHVLSTKKHPGKCLYSCRESECPFTSNLAKEFRVHLITVHDQSASAATSYVAGLYHEGEDPRHVDQPLPATYRKKRKVLKSLSKVTGREEDAILESHSKTLSDNPTLASAVIPGSSSETGRPEDLLRTVIISEPSDDVICIQLPAEDGLEGYDGSSFFRLDLEDHGGLIVIEDEGMEENQPRE